MMMGFFFNFSSPLYLYIFLPQGCTWLEKIAAGMCGAVIVPRAPISSAFISSFLCIASAVMQYMPPALPFQKYLHNIYKIFTKYYNCSNAKHATSSAISKYFHVILKKVQSQRQSTNCLFNFIKEHKPTKSYLPEDDKNKNYGIQKFLE